MDCTCFGLSDPQCQKLVGRFAMELCYAVDGSSLDKASPKSAYNVNPTRWFSVRFVCVSQVPMCSTITVKSEDVSTVCMLQPKSCALCPLH